MNLMCCVDGVKIWNEEFVDESYMENANELKKYTINNVEKLHGLVDGVYIVFNDYQELLENYGGIYCNTKRKVIIRANENYNLNILHEFNHVEFRYYNNGKFKEWESVERKIIDEYLAYNTIKKAKNIDDKKLWLVFCTWYDAMVFDIRTNRKNKNQIYNNFYACVIPLLLVYDDYLATCGYKRKIKENEKIAMMKKITNDITREDIELTNQMIDIVYDAIQQDLD